MSENARTSLADKRTNSKNLSPKKQQKRYHKLEEDLADAQEALEEAQEDLKEAQERVQRSERRVQKRTARIHKIRQKILAAHTSLGEDVSSDPELASWLEEDDESMPQTGEIPVVSPVEAIPEASPAILATTAEQTTEEPVASVPTEETTVASTVSAPEEAKISTPAALDEEPAETIELVSESALEEVAPLVDTADLPETIETSPVQDIPVQATPPASLDEQEETLASTDISPTPVAPALPAYGLRAASAPAERQTDEIVTVRVPSSLQHSASTIEEASTSLHDEYSIEPSISSSETALTYPPVPDDQDQSSSTFTAIAQAQEKVVATETQGVIDEANAVVEAAEEAADFAAERLFEFEQRLDQFVAGRHLQQDLAQLQAEAERTERFALQARQAVSAVETQTSMVEPDSLPSVQPQAELFDADAAPLKIFVPSSNDTSDVTEISTIAERTTEDVPSLAEIDRQEEALEAAVSASITDTAQQESERAEAYAEANGVRAQEARALVERVSMMVDMVVAAIDSGILTGTNADEALAAAEREMSSAQAVLIALNIITERADSYSAEVEAKAEVSGGMSYASEENWLKDTRLSNDFAQIEHEPA